MGILPDCINIELVPDWIWGVMTIAQEARSEPVIGQIAVAEVIRNRMKLKFYSDGSVRDTVLHPFQFSGWNTSDPNRTLCAGLKLGEKVTQGALEALLTAFRENTDYCLGAVSYHSVSIETPDWAKSDQFEKTVTIGRHIFYKKVK